MHPKFFESSNFVLGGFLTICYYYFSTPAKFSRHLIFYLPGAVFKDNIHAGEIDVTLLGL